MPNINANLFPGDKFTYEYDDSIWKQFAEVDQKIDTRLKTLAKKWIEEGKVNINLLSVYDLLFEILSAEELPLYQKAVQLGVQRAKAELSYREIELKEANDHGKAIEKRINKRLKKVGDEKNYEKRLNKKGSADLSAGSLNLIFVEKENKEIEPRIICLRRASTRGDGNCIDLYSNGRIEAEETPTQAASREILEEMLRTSFAKLLKNVIENNRTAVLRSHISLQGIASCGKQYATLKLINIVSDKVYSEEEVITMRGEFNARADALHGKDKNGLNCIAKFLFKKDYSDETVAGACNEIKRIAETERNLLPFKEGRNDAEYKDILTINDQIQKATDPELVKQLILKTGEIIPLYSESNEMLVLPAQNILIAIHNDKTTPKKVHLPGIKGESRAFGPQVEDFLGIMREDSPRFIEEVEVLLAVAKASAIKTQQSKMPGSFHAAMFKSTTEEARITTPVATMTP